MQMLLTMGKTILINATKETLDFGICLIDSKVKSNIDNLKEKGKEANGRKNTKRDYSISKHRSLQ